RHHRSAVEPAGADLPRRQRHHPGRLHRPQRRPLRYAADAGRSIRPQAGPTADPRARATATTGSDGLILRHSTREDGTMYTGRKLLKAGLARGAAAVVGAGVPLGSVGKAGAALRAPNSVPFPNLPIGKPTNAFPFQHLVLVMQENHSFDNYLGMLPKRGQPLADGFTFDANGVPTNSNPLGPQRMVVFHEPDANGTTHTGSQSWNDTHLQINGGAMD